MNPVFLKIGPIELHYYGLMYAIAFFVGISLGKKIAKERNFDLDLVENYAFVAIISGLIGGRLYYVLFNLPYYLQNPLEIPAVWHGGMAIHGGILGGIIGTLIFAKIKKINPLILGDFAAGPFIMGQAIGRIGNFMNGEVHGVPTFTPFSVIFSLKPKFYEWYNYYQSLSISDKANYPELVPWGVVFPTSSPAGSEFPNLPLHPAMLYEMVLNLIGFFIIWFILRKKKNKAPGYMWWWYIIIYSINRIIVSFFRAEDLMFFNFRAPHVISVILIAVSIFTFFFIIFVIILRNKIELPKFFKYYSLLLLLGTATLIIVAISGDPRVYHTGDIVVGGVQGRYYYYILMFLPLYFGTWFHKKVGIADIAQSEDSHFDISLQYALIFLNILTISIGIYTQIQG